MSRGGQGGWGECVSLNLAYDLIPHRLFLKNLWFSGAGAGVEPDFGKMVEPGKKIGWLRNLVRCSPPPGRLRSQAELSLSCCLQATACLSFLGLCRSRMWERRRDLSMSLASTINPLVVPLTLPSPRPTGLVLSTGSGGSLSTSVPCLPSLHFLPDSAHFQPLLTTRLQKNSPPAVRVGSLTPALLPSPLTLLQCTENVPHSHEGDGSLQGAQENHSVLSHWRIKPHLSLRSCWNLSTAGKTTSGLPTAYMSLKPPPSQAPALLAVLAQPNEGGLLCHAEEGTAGAVPLHYAFISHTVAAKLAK